MAKETKSVYWTGIGRRKTAIAAVKIELGERSCQINGKKVDFNEVVEAPLILVGKKDSFKLTGKTNGGGKVSQIEAIRLGLSRALEKFDPEFRSTLKKAGFLSRDPREKERKKPGLKGARRAPQWAKR